MTDESQMKCNNPECAIGLERAERMSIVLTPVVDDGERIPQVGIYCPDCGSLLRERGNPELSITWEEFLVDRPGGGWRMQLSRMLRAWNEEEMAKPRPT